MNEQQQMPVRPVALKACTLEDATQILQNQDPTQLPQWQMHGAPVFAGNCIMQVMVQLDRIKPPTIVAPPSGIHLVR
jgi:hypothetical protein